MATIETSPELAAPAKPLGPTTPWLLLAAGLALALAHLPFLGLHAQHLWQRPHYQFFPFVLVAAVVLAWSRLRGAGTLQRGSSWLGAVLLACAWFLLAAAEILYSPWL